MARPTQSHEEQSHEELAHRSSAGIDVSLFWTRANGRDNAVVSVCDRREGTYFEILAEPGRALEVYYHPFAFRGFSIVDYQDARLAA